MTHFKIKEISKEMAKVNAQYQAKHDQLSAVQEMLNTGFVPPDLELLTTSKMGLNIVLAESPQDFYNRTTLVDVREFTQNIASHHVKRTAFIPIGLKPQNKEWDINDELLV